MNGNVGMKYVVGYLGYESVRQLGSCRFLSSNYSLSKVIDLS